MIRFLARKCETVAGKLADSQWLSEKVCCVLLDWILRNKTRYGKAPGNTFIKATSILRDQHGRYAVLCHYGDKESDVNLWFPGSRFPLHRHQIADQTLPVTHRDGMTTIPSCDMLNPIVIHPPRRRTRPVEDVFGLIDRYIYDAISPTVNNWRFLETQDKVRYACPEEPDLFEETRKPEFPSIYEPVTDRGRLISRDQRNTADSMRKEYQLVELIDNPGELVRNLDDWRQIMEVCLNDWNTYRRMHGIATVAASKTAEEVESRWYDRSKWEYMGHITVHLITGEMRHDMYDVPYQLYDLAVRETRSSSYAFPQFEMEHEGRTYIYLARTEMMSEPLRHRLTFYRKPRRMQRSTQRKYQNCLTCRHWARKNKTQGICRNQRIRSKFSFSIYNHETSTENPEPGALETSSGFGCSEYSSRDI